MISAPSFWATQQICTWGREVLQLDTHCKFMNEDIETCNDRLDIFPTSPGTLFESCWVLLLQLFVTLHLLRSSDWTDHTDRNHLCGEKMDTGRLIATWPRDWDSVSHRGGKSCVFLSNLRWLLREPLIAQNDTTYFFLNPLDNFTKWWFLRNHSFIFYRVAFSSKA